MAKLNAYNFDGAVESFEIDENESYGITQLGYSIRIKNEKRQVLIHPERYRFIEILDGK